MPALSRRLNLPLLVLYGLGTTVGAGIYALLADIARTAGSFAPWSFLGASLLAGLTALSFAELSSRYPWSGATALYVERGLNTPRLATLIGLLLVGSACTSGAALVNGLVGYAQEFAALAPFVIIVVTVILVTLVALWGIAESAWLAGAISLIEIGGVLWIIVLAGGSIDAETVAAQELVPSTGDLGVVFAGAVLSFYAYIGFEDMVEVAEEVQDVKRTLPRAILITLVVTSVLYVALMLSAQLAVSTEFLAQSTAPFADVYRELTGSEPLVFTVVGLLAIVNGVLIQIIMASRVLYGLSSRGALPALLARVSERTHTPVLATLLVAALVLGLALTGTLGKLAKLTSVIMLTVFGLANLALWRIKRGVVSVQEHDGFQVPILIPIFGALCSFAIVLFTLVQQLRG